MTDNPVRSLSFMHSEQLSTKLPYFTLQGLFDSTSGTYDSVINALALAQNTSAYTGYKQGVNMFGFDRKNLFCKLMSYLGYGRYTDSYADKVVGDSALDFKPYVKNFAVSPWPLLAYQKIYQDFFRRPEWESADPSSYNLDYITDPVGNPSSLNITSASNVKVAYNSKAFAGLGMFDLRYSNWQKDLIMGLLPTSQYGSESSAVLNIKNSGVALKDASVYSGSTKATLSSTVKADSTSGTVEGSLINGIAGSTLSVQGDVDLSAASATLSILQLRQAQALQRWKEISLPDGHDYVEQIYKHFGIKPNKALSYMCRYLGGSDSVLDINEVVNTSLDSSDSKADIKGKGTGNGHSKTMSFESDDYGVFMCIYHAVPLLDYDYSGIDQTFLATDATDYPIPEFDSIGLQSQLGSIISNDYEILGPDSTLPTDSIGYTNRYSAWKSSLDVVNGAFRDTLKSWVASLNQKYLTSMYRSGSTEGAKKLYFYYNNNFLKVNPHILDIIFGVDADSDCSTDQFYINSFFDVNVVRNLDYDGMSY